MNKIYVWESLERINDDFEGSLESVLLRLKLLKEKYEGKGYQNLTITCDYDYEYTYYDLTGERLETDKEFDARIAAAKKAKQKRKAVKVGKEKEERALLEKLKKKYSENYGDV